MPLNATSTLGVRNTSARALRRAMERLGGRPTRYTSRHGYVVYEFHDGTMVRVPRHKTGEGLLGKGPLRHTIRDALAAGVPPLLLQAALGDAGCAWHDPPPPRVRAAQRALRRHHPITPTDWPHVLRDLQTHPKGR